jgi:hypothetical protein
MSSWGRCSGCCKADNVWDSKKLKVAKI